MEIATSIKNSKGDFKVAFRTDERTHSLDVPSKPSDFGSDVNGGEFLFLAMAACYCNDLYREAAKRNIEIRDVEVEVKGEFGVEGEAARNVLYSTKVSARAKKEDIIELIKHTDKVAEIQNTLRRAIPVKLDKIQTESI